MATFNIVRSPVDTSTALTISGTVQGTAAITTDYTVSGFTSFTSTAWSVTIPVGVASVLLSVNTVSDAIYEPNESLFLTITANSGGGIDGLNNTIQIVILDDDSSQIVRVVATGGTTLVGNPVLNTASAGIASNTPSFPLTVRFAAANQTPMAINTAITNNLLFDGGRVWLEFAFRSVGNPANTPTVTMFSLSFGGAAFKCDYVGNTLKILSASNLDVPIGDSVEAVMQIGLEGGIYYAYFQGNLAGTGNYNLTTATTAAAIVWSNTTTTGSGYDIAGLKITRGRFTPTFGSFEA